MYCKKEERENKVPELGKEGMAFHKQCKIEVFREFFAQGIGLYCNKESNRRVRDCGVY